MLYWQFEMKTINFKFALFLLVSVSLLLLTGCNTPSDPVNQKPAYKLVSVEDPVAFRATSEAEIITKDYPCLKSVAYPHFAVVIRAIDSNTLLVSENDEEHRVRLANVSDTRSAEDMEILAKGLGGDEVLLFPSSTATDSDGAEKDFVFSDRQFINKQTVETQTKGAMTISWNAQCQSQVSAVGAKN